MSDTNFYETINPFNNFRDILNPAAYHKAPDDWFAVIADIKGSTKAIEQGRYKDVNIVGASCIIAVTNALNSYTKIPFVFGGDGASFVIPPELVQPVIIALQGTREMSQNVYGLEIRVGIVPISEIHTAGKFVNIAKYKMSEHLHIAMFSGGGLSYADKIIKQAPEKHDITNLINKDTVIESNFSGLECRWNPLQTRKGEMLTLIVQESDKDGAEKVYEETLLKIEELYGTNDNYRPSDETTLKLTKSTKNLTGEYKLQNHSFTLPSRTIAALKLGIVQILGLIFFSLNLKTKTFDSQKYKSEVVTNTDFQKFDDVLRMVIDSTPEQSKSLLSFLEDKRKEGLCFYGSHIANSALMTCLIFDRNEKHLHFIDGGDGGYALAAKEMKGQMQ